jgi:hypothetical protein
MKRKKLFEVVCGRNGHFISVPVTSENAGAMWDLIVQAAEMEAVVSARFYERDNKQFFAVAFFQVGVNYWSPADLEKVCDVLNGLYAEA